MFGRHILRKPRAKKRYCKMLTIKHLQHVNSRAASSWPCSLPCCSLTPAAARGPPQCLNPIQWGGADLKNGLKKRIAKGIAIPYEYPEMRMY